MKSKKSTRAALSAGAVVLFALSNCAYAQSIPPLLQKPAPVRMLDARVNAKAAYQTAISARPGVAQAGLASARRNALSVAVAYGQARMRQPGIDVKLSATTGGPSLVRSRTGALTAPSSLANESIVRDFLARNAALYGLGANDLDDVVVLGDSPGSEGGVRMLRVEQQVDGVPVFQSETRFVIDPRGRLVRSVGALVPSPREAVAPNAAWAPPAKAIVRLLESVGQSTSEGAFTAAADGDVVRVTTPLDVVAGEITARKVYFPLAPGVLVPAWSLVVFTPGASDWYAIVDAQTGAVLWRKDIRAYASTHDARFRVYVQADGVTPADSPAPQSPTTATPGSGTQPAGIAPSIVRMQVAQDPVASPNGWIDDCPGTGCTPDQTQTIGNNVVACLDRAAPANVCDTDVNGILDGNGRPTGNTDATLRDRDFLGVAPRDYQTGYLPPPQLNDPENGQTVTGTGAAHTSFRRGAVTQLFYVSNWYHDRLYKLGFDEASANFQQSNLSGQGVGNDRVLADAQDASGTNNANFATPPDGTSGRMQMFRFTGATIDRDGTLDTEIVIHELTHGTSNRLVGNAAGLNWDIAAGLGEGWSDFYALSLLNATNADDPNGTYASGGYATYKLIAGYLDNYLYGIRRFPYSTNNAVNPLTWGDIDDITNSLTGGIATSPINFNGGGALEVHNVGELWANTLWEVRSRVIADPTGANGDVPTGNETMLRLVTDALKLTPIDPTPSDARDALIEADCATNQCRYERAIWEGFADRGLGFGAETPYNASFGFVASHNGIRESFAMPNLAVVDPLADVAILDAATNGNAVVEPGETVRMTVRLTNPWRRAAQIADDVSVVLTSATPGVVIYDGASSYADIGPQGSAVGDSFTFTAPPAALCGDAIDFVATVTSSLGSTQTKFRVRLGTRNGTDPVVTYARDPEPNLAIPDNNPRGATDTLSITDDREIADVDFRVDSLTHTWTGDVTLMLRSPDGPGNDLVSLIGALTDGGPGDNMTAMLIDDDLESIVANDMVQVVQAAAPYTRSWLPTFNAPWATVFSTPDAVGNLSRFDGRSTKGNWTVLVSDQATGDTGTLNAWSMLVTPRHFDCAVTGGAAAVTATKTVAGTFTSGGTVTYTITLANAGALAQADNPGNELVDVLPAGLTLVSASASSGTAVATVGTNTVTWNGAVAPLGGSVTITVTATVNAQTAGLVSNQATLSVDVDGNGTNEATVLSDDPAVSGSADPTVFNVPGADLSVTLTNQRNAVVAGQGVTYTLVAANAGPQSSNAQVGFLVPAGLLNVTWTCVGAGGATCQAGAGNGAINAVNSIPSGGSTTYTISATVAGAVGSTVTAGASVAGSVADPVGANDTAQDADPVVSNDLFKNSFE